jgi:uncharacterized LabA/DUF88 family protein
MGSLNNNLSSSVIVYPRMVNVTRSVFREKFCLIVDEHGNENRNQGKRPKPRGPGLRERRCWDEERLNWEFKPSEKVVFLDSQRVNGHRHLLSKLNWTIQDVVTTDIGMNGEIEYVKNAADMELAMFTLDYAHRFGVDKVVLISGDGDYARLITYLKRLHVEVEAVSLLKSLSPKINEAADEVHYLDHILGLLENEAILSVRSDSIMVEEECSNGQ